MIELVWFTNKQRTELEGVHHHNNSSTVLILMHGMANSKDGYMSWLANALNKYDILRFDFTGHGRSGGKTWQATWQQTQADCEAAITYCVSKGYKQIILVGHSLGGATALLSGKHPAVNAVVSISAPATSEDVEERLFRQTERALLEKKGYVDIAWPNETFRLTKDWVTAVKRIDLLAHCKDLNKPALLLHDKEDKIVPKEHAEKLQKSISHSMLHWVAMSYANKHVFTKEEAGSIATEIAEFLQAQRF